MHRATVVPFGEKELAALNERAEALSLRENAWEDAVDFGDPESAIWCQPEWRMSAPLHAD